MYNKNSRIYFVDNPYPNGHKIKEFKWSIKLIPSKGLWFDFHLVTENYYAEDVEDDIDDDHEAESDWDSKIVWTNYHRCTMSSDNWHSGGFLGGTEKDKFNFNGDNKHFFHLDKLPRPEGFDINDDPVFCIYLLGHDECSDHKIIFTKDGVDKFRINWKGKIALSYTGNYDFDYSFLTEITDVEIPEIQCPNNLTDNEIELLLSKYSVGYKNLNVVKLVDEDNESNNEANLINSRNEVKLNLWGKLKRLWKN